jgi:hypothetical protein
LGSAILNFNLSWSHIFYNDHLRSEDDIAIRFKEIILLKCLNFHSQVLINGDKCIWWKRQYRRWWIGPCKKVGTNSGYAYIKQDVRCASPSFGIEWIELDWRRGGSDKRLKGVQQRYRGCHETFDENGNETGSVCLSVF